MKHITTKNDVEIVKAQRKKIDKQARQLRTYEQRIATLVRELGELRIELDFCRQS